MTPETIGLIKDVLIIPAILSVGWFFRRKVDKKDTDKEKLEEAEKEAVKTWHKAVDEKFENVLNKLTSYCKTNNGEHDELFRAKNNQAERIASIEGIHRSKGCDRGTPLDDRRVA